MASNLPKPLTIVPIAPPSLEQRAARGARFADKGAKKTRYDLPDVLDSTSPVAYRTRVSLNSDEVRQAAKLLSLERPAAFVDGDDVTERALFEECSLGVLSARQSTNFRGFRQFTLGPEQSEQLATLMGSLKHLEAPVLDNARYSHVVFYRAYRTPFTLLLTFVGHKRFKSLATVPWRGLRKRYANADDLPSIGYLPHLHVGILAESMERAAVLASAGRRGANILQGPFVSAARRKENAQAISSIERLCGLTAGDRDAGWRLALVAQVGELEQPVSIEPEVCRKLGANLLAFRSERIQPGINQEDRAPEPYQRRQDMVVPDALVEQAGRAVYNAFSHWSGCDREESKGLILMERIDVLTPGGKARLREIRGQLADITDRVVDEIPAWADLPTGKLLSRSAEKGRKAFALAGQRIYIGGLSRPEVDALGLDWNLAVRAMGAAAARSAIVCELAGVVDIPDGCDFLGGICLMAGPVNQNDIGKQFQGYADLLASAFPNREPTSLLVWTLKAKTVADPVGNEEQLMNARRKGALVDLRPGPHEVVTVVGGAHAGPMRQRAGRLNSERAFFDVGNFLTDPEGAEIPGNRGSAWPEAWAESLVWKD